MRSLVPCYHPSRVPVQVRNQKEWVEVPCGSCLGCRAEQSRQWAVRMMHESTMHEISWFATLTYADKEIPENGSLCPEHLSGFIKDLRKGYPKGSVSFYGCGEYGDHTQRPHLHVVLFGPEFLDRYRDPDISRVAVWRSEALDACWGRGITELGTLTMASASYVAGYVRKKVSKAKHPDHYLRVDPETGVLQELEPEFARMSLRPAIGARWLEKYWTDVYPRDYVVVDGFQAKPPRYYDKWMMREDDKGGSIERRGIMDNVKFRRWEELVRLDDEKLAMKEKCHQSRVELFQARLGI